MTDEPYVKANGRFVPTALYDRGVALTMRESEWRPVLVERALADEPGSVLDLGCGTGTLTLMLAAGAGEARVIGVDGDRDILGRARSKAGAERVEWVEGLAGELPFEDASFDAVVSSLVLHHLGPETKRTALADAHRVLRPGGRLVIADWGAAQDPLMRGMFFLLQTQDGFANTRDHAAGRLPGLIADAGFADVHSLKRLRTFWGSFELLEARRPTG